MYHIYNSYTKKNIYFEQIFKQNEIYVLINEMLVFDTMEV